MKYETNRINQAVARLGRITSNCLHVEYLRDQKMSVFAVFGDVIENVTNSVAIICGLKFDDSHWTMKAVPYYEFKHEMCVTISQVTGKKFYS